MPAPDLREGSERERVKWTLPRSLHCRNSQYRFFFKSGYFTIKRPPSSLGGLPCFVYFVNCSICPISSSNTLIACSIGSGEDMSTPAFFRMLMEIVAAAAFQEAEVTVNGRLRLPPGSAWRSWLLPRSLLHICTRRSCCRNGEYAPIPFRYLYR